MHKYTLYTKFCGFLTYCNYLKKNQNTLSLMCACVKCVTVAAQRHSANTQFVSIKLKDQKKQGRNVKRKHEKNADLALIIRTGSVATLTTSCFTNWKINEQRTDSVSPA